MVFGWDRLGEWKPRPAGRKDRLSTDAGLRALLTPAPGGVATRRIICATPVRIGQLPVRRGKTEDLSVQNNGATLIILDKTQTRRRPYNRREDAAVPALQHEETG